MATPKEWLAKFAKLRVDTHTGDPAPHKPLLLLVVLDLSEQQLLPKDILPLTPELAYRFCTYWSVVAHRRTQRPDIRYPFHFLKSDGVWSPLDKEGNPSLDRRLTSCGRMPADFVAFAQDPAFREQARRILITKYFQPQERVALYSLVGLPIPSDDQIARDAQYESDDEPGKQGREARFRQNIVAAYNYTCALTRYRLITVAGVTILDAAHIHQFADSRNNNPRNGLALCKNAHWLFDNGLWTLSDDYRVIVAEGHFDEAGPNELLLRTQHGQKILLPADPTLWPSPIHIAWHRTKRFKGA
jgi:putative restriction endonuclease